VIPALVPELGCRDLARSHRFYCGPLGFTEIYARAGFACIEHQGARLMLEQLGPGAWLAAPAEPPLGRGMHLQIATRDVLALAGRVPAPALFRSTEEAWYRTDAGFTGQMQIVVSDPDGYLLRFAEPLGLRDTAPGSGRVVA